MSTRLGVWLVRVALRAFPPRFRRRFGESMVDTFADRLAERRRARPLGGLRFTARTVANLAASGFRERSRPALEPAPRSLAERPSPGAWLGATATDARFAVRMLGQRPGFTALAGLTLALGVGANTAIFSVVNGVLLRPLPYPEPEGLVTVLTQWSGLQSGVGALSYPDLVDVERESPALATLVGVNTTRTTITGLGEAMVVEAGRVTKGLLDVFRVAPVLGRDIRADEFGPTGPRITVIGHQIWQTRLGGRANVVGDKIVLNGVSHEIVGVAPPGFDFPREAALWIPRRLDLDGCARGCHTMTGLGRLAPGATLEQARVEIDGVARALEQAFPDSNTNKGFLVRSLQDQIVGDVRPGLLLLLGAVGLVVLIACANVANLLLVRASSRTAEVAIRTALGASRGRIVIQGLIESGMLAILGGLAGLGVAVALLWWLPAVATSVPRLESVSIDLTVLLFTLGTVVAVTLLFGTVPALALGRASVRYELAGAAPGGGGLSQGRRRMRSTLLAIEMALATILLVGASLLLRSFVALYDVDLGFATRNLTRFSIGLPVQYESLDQVRTFYRGLEERIRQVPGVEAAGSIWSAPLASGHATGVVLVEGRPRPAPADEREATIHPVGPGWLDTMGMGVRRGRGLTSRDDVGPEPVGLVNEAFVRQNFPGEDPIGRRVSLTLDMGFGSPVWTIVGIVDDARWWALDDEPEPQLFVPHGLFGPEDLTVTIRSAAGVPVLPAVREILRAADPNVPIYDVETVEEAVDRQVAPTRFYLLLIAMFATLAAVLAGVGIYGVVAFAATCRVREIGLRVALGASRSHVLTIMVAQGMGPAAIGLLFGLTGAYFGGRLMESIIFGVDPRDPWLFLATGALLLIVALGATTIPAYRASRIDPVRALRV